MKPAQRFTEFPAYVPIEPFEVLSKQLGMAVEKITKIDANENPYGPSPKALQALASMDFVNIYPDPENRALREKLSIFTGVPFDNLFPGAGADELIDLILRVMIEPGDSVVNLPPTFGMYDFDAKLNQAKVLEVVRKDDFSLDLPAIQKVISENHPKVLFITSPNNPDGSLLSTDELRQILGLPILVVLDEAYIEFAKGGGRFGERLSWIQEVPKYKNLVVLRTFSKWAGLAGLRVGYGAFPDWMMPVLWRAKQPYNLNVAASTAAIASLEDLDVLFDRVQAICAERERFFSALTRIPFLIPSSSQANFILCKLEISDDAALAGVNAKKIKEDLSLLGVMIRHYDNRLLKNYLRVSVGRPGDSNAFLSALRQVADQNRMDTTWYSNVKADFIDTIGSDISPLGVKKRVSTVSRKTKETDIRLSLNVDGKGEHVISTGIGFFDHMLTQIAVHGLFDLNIQAIGDLEIDPHHLVEDVGLALGQAFQIALGERRGIVRMAMVDCPMDECLAHAVVDFSGRPYSVIQVDWTGPYVGQVPTTLIPHFFESFASQARCNLHIRLEYGRDDHHKAEAMFKSFGRCLDAASQIDPRRASTLPTSKGILF
jgi:histidinol-phosphate aminotransferase